MKKSSINTIDMVQLHSLAQENKAKEYNPSNSDNISQEDGLLIYIKAVKKLETLFTEAEQSLGVHIQTKSRDAHISFTNHIFKCHEIINVFINGLAVIHSEDAKDFMTLLYNRFSFLQDNTNLYYITQNKGYLQEIKTILKRLNETFSKMTVILESTNTKDSNSVLTNAELSV